MVVRFFKREPETKTAGYIAAHGLTKWWEKTFSAEDRETMTVRYQPFGLPYKRPLTEGSPEKFSSTRRFLGTLGGWYNNPRQRHLAQQIMLKAVEVKDGSVLDDHFLYSEMIPVFYPDRVRDPEALDMVIWACEQQISISDKAAKALRKEFPSAKALPAHRGFEQLAVIREKQGRTEEALRLNRAAIKAGWAGSWEKRIERLERKLSPSHR
jgi:hypothetical protein